MLSCLLNMYLLVSKVVYHIILDILGCLRFSREEALDLSSLNLKVTFLSNQNILLIVVKPLGRGLYFILW